MDNQKEKPHTALALLFEQGDLVHIFAGRDGALVWRLDGESVEDWIVRASKLSPHGDVWITPHWC